MADMSFLRILKAALCGEQAAFDTTFSDDEWSHIFKLAEIHRVLPMIYDSAYSAFEQNSEAIQNINISSRLLVSQQAIRTRSFLNMYRSLSDRGLEPIVIKGIICRSLYPNPDFRLSSDEDLLVPATSAHEYIAALKELGFTPLDAHKDNHYQAAYIQDDGLCIELHRTLFPDDSEYFALWNSFFEDVRDRAIHINIGDTKIKTLSPTDHILYLILHSLKHFLHSGVGIRQISDIVLFANTYGSEINWQYIYTQCEKISALQFTAAVFAIGEKYLNFDKSKACFHEAWQNTTVDELPLLQDILSAGIYGSASLERRHSSNITFSAVQGKKRSLFGKVFPSAKSLGEKYHYAKKHPILLPVAWSQRLMQYGKEVISETDNSPAASLRIGKERLDLLHKYGLI